MLPDAVRLMISLMFALTALWMAWPSSTKRPTWQGAQRGPSNALTRRKLPGVGEGFGVDDGLVLGEGEGEGEGDGATDGEEAGEADMGAAGVDVAVGAGAGVGVQAAIATPNSQDQRKLS
jgi:hypothetical protein